MTTQKPYLLLDILDYFAECIYRIENPQGLRTHSWTYEVLRQKLVKEIENANLSSV